MHSNLVGPSRAWNCTDYAKFFGTAHTLGRRVLAAASKFRSRPAGGSHKTTLNMKFSLRQSARWMDHLFKPDRGVLMLALSIQGGINECAFPRGPTADNGQIFFF